MKRFDNFSAIEDLSMDSDFFNISTSLKAPLISSILSAYDSVKNLTATIEGATGYSIALREPEYASYFNTTKLNEATTSTLQTMSSAFGQVKAKIDNGTYAQTCGQSANQCAITDFRNLAQQYYPNLKVTFSFHGDKAKNEILNSLPQEYIDVFKEPFYSENFSQQDKVDANGELVGIALRQDLSLNEKKDLFKDIIGLYAPSLPSSSSSSSSMGSMSSSSSEEQRTEGATTDSKINIAKYAIIGGVLVVGGIATWLILKRK